MLLLQGFDLCDKIKEVEMAETRNVYKILVGKPEGNRLLWASILGGE
jgi:hypothetical protein